MRIGKWFRKGAVLFGIGLIGLLIGINRTNEAVASEMENVTIQEKEESQTLFPIRVMVEDEFKYGYIDETGKMIIGPTYSDAGNFSEGFAVVYNDGKNQMIDTTGKVIFQTEGYIRNFHNGRAAFSDPQYQYKSGYINSEGKVIIKPQYDFAGAFHADQTAYVSKGGKFYTIDRQGKALKIFKFDQKYAIESITDDGYIIVNDPKTFKKGVMRLDGSFLLKPTYGEINYLGQDLFGVKKALPEMEGYLINIKPSAIVNKEGKRITTYQYYDLTEFNGDYASATDQNSIYFIDKKGKKVTTLPVMEGRGTMRLLGDIIQADVDDEMIYQKLDGTYIWKNDGISHLSSGITVSSIKVKPNKYVSVNYPKLDGMSNQEVQNKVNQKLKSLFTQSRSKLKETDYLSVNDTFTVKQIKNLIIINKNGYDYPIGAAHGTPLRFYYFIDGTTGEFYQLKDLFKSGSDYTTKLSKIVSKQMKQNTSKTGITYFDFADAKVQKDQFFYLSEDKLTIYYDTGVITPYAAGYPEFEIPWKDITDIINTNGAFWKAFH